MTHTEAHSLVNIIRADNLASGPIVISMAGRLGYDEADYCVQGINPRQPLRGGRCTFGTIAQYLRWRSRYDAEFRAKARDAAAA